MVEDVLKETRHKMKATLGVFEQDLAGLRSNRAGASADTSLLGVVLAGNISSL